MTKVKQLTQKQAIAFEKSKIWETEKWTYKQIAEFQLFQKFLCMPFDVFRESIEKTLERTVFTHEFGLNVDGLKKELLGERNPTSLEEILKLIPKEKRMLIFV